MRIQVISGPNINLSGKREPSIYGGVALGGYPAEPRERYADVQIDHFQSNIKRELIGKIQQVGFDVGGIILSADACIHTPIALQGTIRLATSPVIKVHIPNVYIRGEFRHVSVIACVCWGVIRGFRLDSYRLALEILREL